MSEPTNLEVFRGSKIEPCLYCGKAPHPTVLSCPRISAIDVEPGTAHLVGLSFHEGWTGEDDEPVAG
jgi:hypothetical protein